MREYVKPTIEIIGFENKDSILTASSVKINKANNVWSKEIKYNQLDMR
jgi:hypothetical protein